MNPPPLPQPVKSMRRLSSENGLFGKRALPWFWFGISGISLVAVLVGIFAYGRPLDSLEIPLGFAVAGFFMMKIFVWGVVDEVWDDHDWLVVRNEGQEARIELLNIIDIDHSRSRPEVVKLTLREPCLFGRSIKFFPPDRFFQWGKPPVVTELALRIDDKRRMAAVCDGA
jgi:hypothetical protein